MWEPNLKECFPRLKKGQGLEKGMQREQKTAGSKKCFCNLAYFCTESFPEHALLHIYILNYIDI